MGPASTLLGMFWFIGAAALVAYVVTVLLFLRHQRAWVGDEARCGACGYPRRGLPGPICPECGNDVNVVGLRRPTWWTRRSPSTRRLLLLAAWTVGLGGASTASWTPCHAYVQPGVQHVFDLGGLWRVDGAYRLSLMRIWKAWMWPWQKRDAQRDPGWPIDRFEVQVGAGYWYPRAEPISVTSRTWRGRTLFNASLSQRRYAWRIEVPSNLRDGASGPADVLEGGQGEWAPAFERWAEIVAERHQLVMPRAEVCTALRAALAAPFARTNSVLGKEYRACDLSYGFGWDCDRRFVFVFAGVWALLWLVGLVWIIRTRDRAPIVAAREVSTGEAVAP